MTISELADHTKKLKVDSITGLKKADIIFKILEAQTKQNGLIFAEGV
ncbi:Rho termination factor N-terminal domain-containing protein, partial [Candidatus Omnitrophota bacterium]